MSFLYRIPLFQFNIDDPIELEENRASILGAISLSSPAFAKELEQQSFENLDRKARSTLRKYLVRGRFRPTPFGKFAGVGIGNWGMDFQLGFPLTSIPTDRQCKREIPANADHCYEGPYQVVPGIHKKHGYYHALVFDRDKQSWSSCRLPVNQLIDTLLERAADSPIHYRDFLQMLNPQDSGIPTEQAKHLWDGILDSGLLSPATPRGSQTNGVDVALENTLEIPEKTKDRLQGFLDSAGSLFAREESTYLRDFKAWFSRHYDDRHVSLHDLLANGEFIGGQFRQPKEEEGGKDIACTILGKANQKTIDLKEHFPTQPLDEGIYDIQLLYRLGPDGNPVVENLVCNRPFVYTGRFNRHPGIKAHTQKIRNAIYTDEKTMYAHIHVHEGKPVNHICAVHNIFDFEITPFKPISPGQLDFRDCYLCIHENRISMVHGPSGRPIVPVVLHPLNGGHITHPVLQLLWEIAHQDRYRFLPYQSSLISQMSPCPQLNWGDLCIQSKRWKLSRESIQEYSYLSQKLDEMDLPQHFLAGNQDRELLLNRSEPEDLRILWKELRRNETLTLGTPLWHASKLFRIPSGAAVYPQFVYQYSRPRQEPITDQAFNPIHKKQQDCLCFTIRVCDPDVPEVLDRLFHYIGQKGISSQLPSWFFLVYGKDGATEIRLRLLHIPPGRSGNLLATFSTMFSGEGWDWKTASYFPETAKYGTDGLTTSHRLFHLESMFLASTIQKTPNINLPQSQKENEIVRLWKDILIQSPNHPLLFRELKENVKRIPAQKLKTYKSDFSFLTNSTQEIFPTGPYFAIIRSHEYFHTRGPKGVYFLLNHLHMMVNRFFPLDTQHHERSIRYRLYRELGKQLYTDTNKNPKSNSNPAYELT